LVTSLVALTKFIDAGPLTTWMGDLLLQVGKPYKFATSQPGQLYYALASCLWPRSVNWCLADRQGNDKHRHVGFIAREVFYVYICYLRQGGCVFAGFCLFVCLSVCEQDNSKSYGRIFLKF